MGYYSTVESTPRIKQECIKTVRRMITKVNKNIAEAEDWQWFLEDLEVEDNGNLAIQEYTAKHYDTDKLAHWLKDKAEGRLEFVGEDGERWGYEFDGKGKAYQIRYNSIRGAEL